MREYVSAKFLLADKPSKRDVVIIPANVVIHHLPTKVARGARKPRSLALGGAKPATTIAGMADRNNIKGLAARGW